jgi:hypothetical protein
MGHDPTAATGANGPFDEGYNPNNGSTLTLRSQLLHSPFWKQWLQWVIACGIGGALVAAMLAFGGVLIPPIEDALRDNVPLLLLFVAGAAAAELLFSLPQWLILRRYPFPANRWIDSTVLGGVAGVAVAAIAVFPFGALVVNVLHLPGWVATTCLAAIAGAVLGSVQGLAVRLHGRRLQRWVLASAAGIVGLVAGIAATYGSTQSLAGGLIVGGLAYGLITGTAAWFQAINALAILGTIHHPSGRSGE